MDHRRRCILPGVVIALAAAPSPAAEAPFPAPSNVRGRDFPAVHADLRVTFRVEVPEAESVAVAARAADSGMHGDTPQVMARGDDGVWTVTTEPVQPGFHYYHLVIDGHRVNDPASETYFGWGKATSGLEVPDPELDFYDVEDVPHGRVGIHWYHSGVTGGPRQVYVYTPPGYDAGTERYPVLYLQHGAGENQTSWTWQGKANLILDNLIAAGEARPMIVVMDCGYARKAGTEGDGRSRGNGAFGDVVVEDLIPFIDGSHRTVADRRHRAIAGLSMGAGQALSVGFAHLDLFASIAAFSGGGRTGPLEATGLTAEQLNDQIDLLWIGCGEGDRAYERLVGFHQQLEGDGVGHVWFPGPGSHEWQVWRKHLHDLAPRLFGTGHGG